MDKDMLRRAEESLDERRLHWIQEAAEEQAMTGYSLKTADIMELERRYPKLMREIDQGRWSNLFRRKDR
jgi:hypothetical protein